MDALIHNLSHVWKTYTAWAVGAVLAIAAAWPAIPADVKAVVPEGARGWVALACTLILLARVAPQKNGGIPPRTPAAPAGLPTEDPRT